MQHDGYQTGQRRSERERRVRWPRQRRVSRGFGAIAQTIGCTHADDRSDRENQERLCEPERPILENMAMPELDQGGAKGLLSGSRCQCNSHWPQNPAKKEQRETQTHPAVGKIAP